MTWGHGMKHGMVLVSLAVAAGLTGCASNDYLAPASGASVVGQKGLTVETRNGVRVYVHGHAWNGDPSDLAEVMTPVYVTVQNLSSQPIRLAYADFALVGGSGLRYQAIPPLRIDRLGPERVTPVAGPSFYYDRFLVAPSYRAYYPGLPAWPYAFPYDPFYYDSLWVAWRQPLPTANMLSKALPEGVLQPGGSVSGFLYFDQVTDREKTVTFQAHVAEKLPGRQVASIAIPFVTK